MRLFKDYTEEFKKIQKGIERIGNEQDSQYQSIVKIEKEQEQLRLKQQDLADKIDLILELLQQPNEEVSEGVTNPPSTHIWEIPKTAQRLYKNILYTDFEFVSKNKRNIPLYDISDVFRLSKFIDGEFISKSELQDFVIPNLSRSAFVRMLYNFQEGYFDRYLDEYAKLEFGVDNNYIVINDIKSSLTVKDAKEIISLLVNAKDFYECLDGLTHSYNPERVKWVKIIADNYNNKELLNCLKLKKQHLIENNPQKRREMGLS